MVSTHAKHIFLGILIPKEGGENMWKNGNIWQTTNQSFTGVKLDDKVVMLCNFFGIWQTGKMEMSFLTGLYG